ncbi:MAG: hypothetical protein WDW36_002029 [Sanguina aurantia]
MTYQLGTPLTKVHAAAAGGVTQHANWSPYDDNGGTVVAVAGEDYCIVAASCRMSTGYSILTRHNTKICQLTPKALIASAGMQADMATLHKHMQAHNVMYQHTHAKPLSVSAVSQLMGNTLYGKRFFPYYTFNIVAGLDENGRGAVYSYDAIGSFERSGYACQGSGKELVQPVLDNQLKAASPLVLPAQNPLTALPLEQAIDLVKDAFVSAGERDIYTGDLVEIVIMTKDGIRRDELMLKLD